MPLKAAMLPTLPVVRFSPRKQRRGALVDLVEDIQIETDKIRVIADLIVRDYGDSDASVLADTILTLVGVVDDKAGALLAQLT